MKTIRWMFALAIGLAQVALAADPPRIGDTPAQVGQQGFVRETSDRPGFVDVLVKEWTGTLLATNVKRVPLEFNPKTKKWEALIPVGKKVDGRSYVNCFYTTVRRPKSCDPLVSTIAASDDEVAAPNNEVAHLTLSSMYLGDDGFIHEEAFFGRLARMAGLNELHIPDAFSSDLEADADGDLTLYSVVNLLIFGPLAPSFSFGDEFMITGGVSALFPGMQFSSTPFTFDPLLGFVGTDFNGMATIHAAHEVFAIPEPSSVILLLSALGMTFVAKRHKKSR